MFPISGKKLPQVFTNENKMQKKLKITGTSKVIRHAKTADFLPDSFTQAFLRNGYRFVSNFPSDYAVFWNHQRADYRRFIDMGGHSDRAALLRFEPEAVYPSQYHSKVDGMYGIVLSPGRVAEESRHGEFTPWPYTKESNPLSPRKETLNLLEEVKTSSFQEKFLLSNWLARPKNLTMILSNKVSPIKSSQYQLRRDLASSLSPSEIEIFGELWNDDFGIKLRHRAAVGLYALRSGTFPDARALFGDILRRYPNAYGPIQDKHQVLAQSRYSLVIENSQSVITEKLIDALINGSIPVYFGPDLGQLGILESMVLRADPSRQGVLTAISRESNKVIENRLNEMYEFLAHSDFFEKYSSLRVMEAIAQKILNYFQQGEK